MPTSGVWCFRSPRAQESGGSPKTEKIRISIFFDFFSQTRQLVLIYAEHPLPDPDIVRANKKKEAAGERDMLMDASRRGEAYEAHVLKAFLASLDEVARGRLPVRLPAAAAEFDPAWSLGDLRNVVRLHAMHRAKARAQRRRAQVQQPLPQGGGGVAQPQLQQQQGAVGIDVPLRHVAPAS